MFKKLLFITLVASHSAFGMKPGNFGKNPFASRSSGSLLSKGGTFSKNPRSLWQSPMISRNFSSSTARFGSSKKYRSLLLGLGVAGFAASQWDSYSAHADQGDQRPKENSIIHFFKQLVGVESTTHNAGILPCCIRNGKLYILLGQENYGSPFVKNTWCDFGGKGEAGEALRETAKWEGTEETRATFGKFALEHGHSKNISYVAASNSYFELRIIEPPIIAPDGSYHLYVTPVDHIPAYKFKQGPLKHWEKKRFKWVPAEDFVEQASKNSSYTLRDKKTGNQFVLKIRPEFIQYFRDAKTQQELQNALELAKKAVNVT